MKALRLGLPMVGLLLLLAWESTLGIFGFVLLVLHML